MTGYEAYCLFNAIKLHFTSSYDYFKYNGKTHNATKNNFDIRSDKYHFYKISREYPNKEIFIDLLVANFLEQDKVWVGDLLSEGAREHYLNHQKVIQSLSHIFENDCIKIFDDQDNPNNILKTNGEYPILLIKGLQKDIHFETLCILNMILNFMPMWKSKIEDTIYWPNYSKKIEKYACFLPQNVLKYKMILKKTI